MRSTITAFIVAAGLAGFAAAAQAAPVAASKDLGIAGNDAIVHVQMDRMERRMMHRRMERRMMRRNMERRMMRRHMERRMMRREMRREMRGM